MKKSKYLALLLLITFIPSICFAHDISKKVTILNNKCEKDITVRVKDNEDLKIYVKNKAIGDVHVDVTNILGIPIQKDALIVKDSGILSEKDTTVLNLDPGVYKVVFRGPKTSFFNRNKTNGKVKVKVQTVSQ